MPFLSAHHVVDSASARRTNSGWPVSRFLRCPGHRRTGGLSASAAGGFRRCLVGAAAENRAGVFRARAQDVRVPRLGNPALRSVFAARRSGVGTSGHALRNDARHLRCRHRAGYHRSYALDARGVPRRQHLFLQAGRQTLAGRTAPPVHHRRLHPRHPGSGARRIQFSRRADRYFSDGQRAALSHRPLRRRYRFDPQL